MYQQVDRLKHVIYGPQDWERNNQKWYNQSNDCKDKSQQLQDVSRSICRDKDTLTKFLQEQVTKALAERAKEIYDKKIQLEKAIDNINAETLRLIEFLKRLKKALATSEVPLMIANECLDLRNQRVGSDIVQDKPQMELMKEIDTVGVVQDLYKDAIRDAEFQIERNLKAKQDLERDWSDKHEAYNIDANCGKMTINTPGLIQFRETLENVPTRWSSPEKWEGFTKANITAAEAELRASENMRKAIGNLLTTAADDLMQQSDNVKSALAERIVEEEECRFNLNSHQKELAQEIANTEKAINDTRQAIFDKENPLKKAQSRLYNRFKRPSLENCRDPAQDGLVKELTELHDTIDTLKQQLAREEEHLVKLFEIKSGLEEEEAVKRNTLSIDRDRCIILRRDYPPQHKLLGY